MSWRNKLQWREDLLDIDYWLHYSKDRWNHNPELEEWMTDSHEVFKRAVVLWLRESDTAKEDKEYIARNETRIKKFIEDFINQHGEINASIVQAFISQEGV